MCTHLSEPGLISAGFQWTGSIPAGFQTAFSAEYWSQHNKYVCNASRCMTNTCVMNTYAMANRYIMNTCVINTYAMASRYMTNTCVITLVIVSCYLMNTYVLA